MHTTQSALIVRIRTEMVFDAGLGDCLFKTGRCIVSNYIFFVLVDLGYSSGQDLRTRLNKVGLSLVVMEVLTLVV